MNKDKKSAGKTKKDLLLYKPYIAVNHQYSIIWDRFTELYNEDKPKGEHLRTPHFDLFYLLVRLLSKQIKKDNETLRKDFDNPLNPNEPYPFYTNSAYLARLRRYASKKTIYNQLNRLQDAGVITKKGHGSYRNFEVIINPAFLLISDYAAPEYAPAAPEFFKSGNQIVAKEQSKTLPMYLLLTDDPLNKKINAVETVEKKAAFLPSGETVNETGVPFNRYPAEHNQSPAAAGKEKEKKVAPKKEKESPAAKKWAGTHFSKDWWVNMFVEQFYAMLITYIFSKHDIWEIEEQRTKERITEWFSGIKNPKQGVDWMNQAEWRMKAAARFYKAHNYDISNIFPDRYIDPENEYGFARTAKWWEKHRRNRLRKEQELIKHRQNLEKHLKLQEKVKEYAQKMDIHTYRKCEEYVKTIIPELMPQFVACVQKLNAGESAEIALPVWKYKKAQAQENQVKAG